MSELMIAAWATVGVVLLGELLWKKFFWTRYWPAPGKLAAIAAIAIVVYGGSFITFIRPNITFQTSNDSPYTQSAADGSRWLRVLAYNRGWRETTCRFFLHRLEKEGLASPIVSNEYLQLLPGGGQELSAAPDIPIPSDQGRYITLAYVPPTRDKMAVQSGQFTAEFPGKLTEGIYRFTIIASFSTCRSDPTVVRVKYGGGDRISVVK